MKVLMLILASNGYDNFKAVWKKYMNSHPQIDCYFYIGNPNMIKEAELIGDTIYVKVDDSLPFVYQKLMATLKFLEPQLDMYDFLFRTNLSSFIDYKKYVPFCETLPKTNVCAAVVGEYKNIYFPSGSGFTLSIDLVKRLVRENPPIYYTDDVTIGKILKDWSIPIIPVNRIDYITNREELLYTSNSDNLCFHYRFKTDNRDEDSNRLMDMYLKLR